MMIKMIFCPHHEPRQLQALKRRCMQKAKVNIEKIGDKPLSKHS